MEVAGRESGDGGKEKGKEREGEVGIFFIICGPHINTSYVAPGGKKFNRVAAT